MLLMPLGISSQIKRLGRDVQYGVSLRGTFGEGDKAPFWFTNNRYGLGAVKNNTVLARTYIKRDVEADSSVTEQTWLQDTETNVSSMSSRHSSTYNGR